MPSFTFRLALIVAAIVVGSHIRQASAQSTRTFVSGHGSDTGSCALVTPCRTLNYAVTQTSAGGEVAVLDTAGYGPVMVSKSISITAQEGIEAGIAVTSPTNGVTVSAGPNDVVNLRGLILTGSGVGVNGIQFNSGKSLTIQNCSIRGFTSSGIFLVPGASSIAVFDTILSNNEDGITFSPSANASAFFQRVQSVQNSRYGFFITSEGIGSTSVVATATDSVAAANGQAGFFVTALANQGQITMAIDHSKIFNNLFGVKVSSPSGFPDQTTVSLTGSSVIGSIQGATQASNSHIWTYGNNTFPPNDPSVTGLVSVSLQ
jgi:hypothetical protein